MTLSLFTPPAEVESHNTLRVHLPHAEAPPMLSAAAATLLLAAPCAAVVVRTDLRPDGVPVFLAEPGVMEAQASAPASACEVVA